MSLFSIDPAKGLDEDCLAAKESVWQILRCQAEGILTREPALRPLIYEAILKHSSFTEALIHRLALRLSDQILSIDFFLTVFRQSIAKGADIERLAMEDLIAVEERDPACRSIAQVFLYFKAYQSIQSYRMSHVLWLENRKDIAMVIQGRSTEVFGVDIHPGCMIGPGLMIDHGTGVVIGETAIIGEDCCFMHGITLGGTGTSTHFDRHPKIGNRVFLGCGVTILGNIRVGDNCRVGAGSLVLKGLPDGATAVGSPALIKSLDPRYANPSDFVPSSDAAAVLTEFSSEIEKSKSLHNIQKYLEEMGTLNRAGVQLGVGGDRGESAHVEMKEAPTAELLKGIKTWRKIWYPKVWCNKSPITRGYDELLESISFDGIY